MQLKVYVFLFMYTFFFLFTADRRQHQQTIYGIVNYTNLKG
jgi:hypothetical protein